MTHNKKILSASVALLAAAPDKCLGVTQLNKALFYLDLATLRDHGTQATDSTYLALERGPVLANYKRRLVKPLIDERCADRHEGHPLHLLNGAEDRVHIEDEVLELANKVAAWAASKAAASVSDFSHENLGWQLAYGDGIGSPQPIDMHIAMQQIIDTDPWQEPLDEATMAIVEEIDSGAELYDW